MSTQPRASLLLATYEMARHLELVLTGLARQSVPQDAFEILICDDGSGQETRDIVEHFKAHSGRPTTHLWQEHQGFRKCRILNEALRIARGKTLVFLDGDCVPHRDFIRDHLDNQESGRYLAGRRVELGPWFSATLTPDEINRGLLDGPSFKLLFSCMREDSTHFQRSLRIPDRGILKMLRGPLKLNEVPDLKGCNFSLAREAMEAINGFDETYEGYGREDSDVEIRLQNLGLSIKSMKGMALQYHVWHPRRDFTPANDDRLDEVRRDRRVVCASGMRRIN